MMRLTQSFVLPLTAGALLLTACGEGTGPNADREVGVGFRLASSSSSANIASSASPDGTAGAVTATSAATATGFSIKSGTDEIVVSKAQIVVKDVKLKSTSCAATSGDDDDDDEDEDDCPTIRTGPFLLDVPVNGTDGGRVDVPVPAGTYTAVRLSIHKVSSSDAADLAFRQANPDFRGISIRLEGTYNGTPFVFVHDVNAKMDVPLSEAVAIGEEGGDVTVTIDMTDWFTKPAGGLYSPAEGNTPGFVRAKIQNNIRNAFRAFRDDNRDGKDDDN